VTSRSRSGLDPRREADRAEIGDDDVSAVLSQALGVVAIASKTTPRAGGTPRRRAASRNIAGSGLPANPMREASAPSTRTWKRSVSRATRRMVAVLRLDETTAVLTPCARASRTSAMADWYTVTPSRASRSRK
jgi:hypothetical protein